jgi:hypothetical protein
MDKETQQRLRDIATTVMMLDRHMCYIRTGINDFRVSAEELGTRHNVLQLTKDEAFQQFIERGEDQPVREPVAIIRGVDYYEGDTVDWNGEYFTVLPEQDQLPKTLRVDDCGRPIAINTAEITLYARAGVEL